MQKRIFAGFLPGASSLIYIPPILFCSVVRALLDATESKEEANQLTQDEDEDHNSPLHLAARTGHYIVAEILIKHGADVEAKYETLHLIWHSIFVIFNERTLYQDSLEINSN